MLRVTNEQCLLLPFCCCDGCGGDGGGGDGGVGLLPTPDSF
jgi:hypothetical protein